MSPRIGVIVPALNSGRFAAQLTAALGQQSRLPDRLLVVDSASTDGSNCDWARGGAEVLSIDRTDFDHGGTRNLAADHLSDCDILVFMTQDVVPRDSTLLAALVAPIETGEVAGTFARQIARPHASPLEAHSREYNYPAASYTWSAADIAHMGIRSYFFSNACSAVNHSAFNAAGRFPSPVIMNEDMVLAARLLHASYSLRYVAEAEVIHSHDYNLMQHVRRSFDTGVALARYGDELKGADAAGEGIVFLRSAIVSMLHQRRIWAAAAAPVVAAARFLAYRAGRSERWLPVYVKRILSMHSTFWP